MERKEKNIYVSPSVTVDIVQMENPVLSINGATVAFPCSLKGGDTLRCLDGKSFDVVSASGKLIATGNVKGGIPPLKAGVNSAKLEFGKTGGKDFKVLAKITKVY